MTTRMMFCALAVSSLAWLAAPARAAPPKTGVVAWFNESKGYGLIEYSYPYRGQQKTKRVLAHWSEVTGPGFRSLQRGQQVQFSIARRLTPQVKQLNQRLRSQGQAGYKASQVASGIRVLATPLSP